MSDLKRYVQQRSERDADFAENYEVGYADFKIGVILRQAREAAGLTQDEIAQKLKTQKSAISASKTTRTMCASPRFAAMPKPWAQTFTSD